MSGKSWFFFMVQLVAGCTIGWCLFVIALVNGDASLYSFIGCVVVGLLAGFPVAADVVKHLSDSGQIS